MDYKQLAEEMKAFARANPLNVLEGLLDPEPIMLRYRRSISDNFMVILTLDELGSRKAWHLSFRCDTIVPDEVCEELKKLFLPCKQKCVEIPSEHGPSCRQFVEIADETK